MATQPQYTIERDVHVGIWDAEDTARVYADRTVAHIATVRWIGSTGGYHEAVHRITGAAHDAIVTALADGAEETAWDEIYRYVN